MTISTPENSIATVGTILTSKSYYEVGTPSSITSLSVEREKAYDEGYADGLHDNDWITYDKKTIYEYIENPEYILLCYYVSKHRKPHVTLLEVEKESFSEFLNEVIEFFILRESANEFKFKPIWLRR